MQDKINRIKEMPYVSGGLVLINILIFLWCTFDGNMLYNVGVLSPFDFFEKKQYYRLISSMFLHGDIAHLINNMLLLFGIGTMLEKEIGHGVFAIIYLLTGIVGGMVSLFCKVFSGEWYVGSIGASGAVFGLIGVLLAMAFFSGIHLPNVTPMKMIVVVVYSVYSGMGDVNIDNAAHVGGAAAGVFAGLILSIGIRIKKRKERTYKGEWHEN